MNKNSLFYSSYYNKIDDVLNIMMYDVDTGEYSHKRIKRPEIDVYVIKNGVDVPSYYKETMPLTDLNSHKVQYKWREYSIADILGRRSSFTQAVREGKMRKSHIFLDRRVFGADLNIEDLTIMKYLDSLGYEIKDGKKEYFDVPPIKNIRKGFYDIETDIRNTDDRRLQPITCSTYYDQASNTAEVFAHIRKDFKRLNEVQMFEDKFKEETKDTLRKLIRESTADEKTKELLFPKFNKIVDEMKINIHWYEKEKTMIKESWKMMIQDYKPMFLGIFNAMYDLQQTEFRADYFGIDRAKLFTNPEIGSKYWFDYSGDAPKAAENRNRYLSESYTKFVDTRKIYCSLRPQDNIEQESLDYINNKELGFGKLSYKHITDHIRHLPYLDYWLYLMYNMVDTIIMSFQDMKTDDLESLLTRRFIVRSEYERLFSPMASCSNTFFHLVRRMGHILSNDVNKIIMTKDLAQNEIIERLSQVDTAIKSTYDTLSNRIAIGGGLCSDPVLFKKEMTPIVEGLVNNKFASYVLDADAVSMYPKIIEHTNVSKDSLDGRITAIDMQDDEALIKQAVQALIDKSPVRIGTAFFNLPTVEQIYKDYFELDVDIETPKDKENKVEVLDLDETQFKYAENIRKIFNKFDKTKVNASDKEAGMEATVGLFHINKNISRMKINGSLYEVYFNKDSKFPYESLSEVFGDTDGKDLYISKVNGLYQSEDFKYIKPKDISIDEDNTVYEGFLDKDLLEKIENNDETIISLDCNGKKLDITRRTHTFLSDEVHLTVTRDNFFIFKYNINVPKVGTFYVRINTKALQY